MAAMLRVSSYRKLFEDGAWGPNGGARTQCAGQYRALARKASKDECDCDKLDFVAAKELNRDGLTRFVQDRQDITKLNDRLVRLIELARCFEEENESLECQIVELEEELESRRVSSNVTSSSSTSSSVPDYSLDAAVERLRRERDEILCDSEELQKELECLMKEYEETSQQRLLLQQGRQDVAQEVDAVTAECLALREQVAIYEEQLANMEAQHITAVGTLLDPAEATPGAVTGVAFRDPDITPALEVKELYLQLAESLQYECGAASSAVVHRHGDGKQQEVGGARGSTVRDVSKIKDVDEMKELVSELQKELAELEKCNEELEDEVEMKTAAYEDQIEELECTLDEMRYQEADFQLQMKDQCEDYKELLNEKMARNMEVAAYRALLEVEEDRLCSL